MKNHSEAFKEIAKEIKKEGHKIKGLDFIIKTSQTGFQVIS